MSRTRSASRPAAAPPAAAPGPKRIIVCCDGTWLNADAGIMREGSAQPSNVTRITRALVPLTHDGVQQLVYYSAGVGSTGGIVEKIYSGVTGAGISGTIREVYSFICLNWLPGDDIFLIGFSRGAFTARAIGGLIDCVGLLTRGGQTYLADVFTDVQHRHDPRYKSKLPFRDAASALDPAYAAGLARRGLTRPRVRIKAIGVWETVGALGIPRIGWLEAVGLQSAVSRIQGFYDTALPGCVDNAFQALALNERRSAFTPAVWEMKKGNRARLRQVWFPGVHSNVGGGYADQGMANITLAWMMSQLRGMLEFDGSYLLDEAEELERWYKKESRLGKNGPWSFGEVYNSLEGIYILGGSTTRTPGRYYEVNPRTDRPTERPLRDTHEYIHPSARTRIDFAGPGLENKGDYEPRALKEWKLEMRADEQDDGRGPDVAWHLETDQRNVSTRVLPESPLAPLERELLEYQGDAAIVDAVLRPEPGRESTGRRTVVPPPQQRRERQGRPRSKR